MGSNPLSLWDFIGELEKDLVTPFDKLAYDGSVFRFRFVEQTDDNCITSNAYHPAIFRSHWCKEYTAEGTGHVPEESRRRSFID